MTVTNKEGGHRQHGGPLGELGGPWSQPGGPGERDGKKERTERSRYVEVPYIIDPYHAGIENRKKEKIRFPIPAWYGAAAQKLLSD